MLFADALRNAQAYAVAPLINIVGLVFPVKTVKKLVTVHRLSRLITVGDGKLNAPPPLDLLQFYPNRSILIAVFDGIGQEVGYHLLDAHFVAEQGGGKVRIGLHLEGEAFVFRSLPYHVHQVV